MQSEILANFQSWVKKGDEYTIREILDNDNIVTGVLLEEIHNTPLYFNLIKRVQEPAFATWRFEKEIRSTAEESCSIKESLTTTVKICKKRI